MTMKTSPFKTPPGFFEDQQRAIWKHAPGAATLDEPRTVGVPTWIGWTVGVAAALVLALVVGPGMNEPACQTFACLWESTPAETLQLDDSEIDLWMEDDLLFETILYDENDV